MNKYFLILFLFLLLLPAFASIKEGSNLVVNGSGSVFAEPDTATVRLGVEVQRQTAEEAQNENARIMNQVAASIYKLGIAKEKVQTSGYNVWPEKKYPQNQAPQIVGYRCSNQVTVTLEDLKKISKVIDTGIASGANNVHGVQFSLKDDLATRQEALEKAVKIAKSKAQSIALASGVKLGKIDTIIEGSSNLPQPLQGEVLAMARGAGDNETPIAAGLIEIRANVTLAYKIE